jgi:uncharacterized membrane protein
MAKFCTQCGASASEGARFCNRCGAKLMPTQPAPQPETAYKTPPGGPSYGQNPYQPPFQAPYSQSGAPGSPAAGADLRPNVAGLLCYPLSFVTGILFLVLAPYNKDPFIRFHAYQSIFFFVAMLALNITAGIFAALNPVDVFDALIFLGLRLLALGGTGWLMYQAYQGNRYKLPVIGDLAEAQAAKQ